MLKFKEMNPNNYQAPQDQSNQYQPPNQPYDAPPSSVNYLDSIASPIDTRPVKPWLIWVLIGGVVALLGLFGVLLASASGPSQTEQVTNYLYRVQLLQKVATDNETLIQSSELRKINAATKTILIGAGKNSEESIAQLGLKPITEVPEKATINTEFTELNAKLDDARLNAIFDSVYAREMAYQLGKLRAEMQTIYDSTSNKTLKSYLETTDANIKPFISQYTDYNNTKS